MGKKKGRNSDEGFEKFWPDFLRIWPNWSKGASFTWVKDARPYGDIDRDYNQLEHFTLYFFRDEAISFMYALNAHTPSSMEKSKGLDLGQKLLEVLLQGKPSDGAWHLIRVGKKWM